MKLALLFVAGCWTSQIQNVGPTQNKPTIRKRVQCWSTAFHEDWPERVWYGDALTQCEAEWPDEYSMVATCVALTMERAYERLSYWTERWFEACDPARRP